MLQRNDTGQPVTTSGTEPALRIEPGDVVSGPELLAGFTKQPGRATDDTPSFKVPHPPEDPETPPDPPIELEKKEKI